MHRRPPTTTLSPYTTLFRSDDRDRLERSAPVTMTATARMLAEQTGVDVAVCRQHLKAVLLAGYATTNPETGFPLFRSEEHTSELQSLTNLVCRLLLEKKRNH